MTQDLYYYETGYIDESYFVYTADAESSISTQATMTVAIGVIKESSSTMSSAFTQTAIISHIEGADLFAMSNASLAAEVSRIRDNNINVTAAFTQVTAGAKFIHFGSDQFIDATISAVNTRVRFNQAAIDAAFSLAADVTRIPGGGTVESNGTWTSNFSLTAVITNLEGADLSAFTNASVSASVDKFTGISAGLNANASVSAQTLRIQTSAVTLESNTTVSALVQFTAGLASNLTATASSNIAVGKIVQLQSFESSLFSPSVVCNAVRNTFAVLDNSFLVVATGIVTKKFTSSLTSQSSLSAQIRVITFNSVNLSSSFTEVVNAQVGNKRPWQILNNGTSLSSTQSVLGGYSLYAPTGTSLIVNPIVVNNFKIDNNKDFNLEFFYYPTHISTSTSLSNILRYNFGSTTIWRLGGIYNSSQPRLQFEIFNQNSSSSTFTSTGTFFTQNSWHYIRVYKDNTGLYVQGATKTGSTWSSVTTLASTAANYYNPSTPDSGFLTIGGASGQYYGYYDEVFISNGSSTREQFLSGTTPNKIVVGADSSTQALFHFDNTYEDDIHGIAKFTSNLITSSNLTASVGKLTTTVASLSSTSSVTANATRITQASATLSSNGFVAVAVGRIRPFVDIEVATFSLDGSLSVVKVLTAILSSTSTVNCEITKTIGIIIINANSNAQLTSDYSVFRGQSSTIIASSSLVANVGLIRQGASDQTNNTAIAAVSDVVKVAQAALSASTSISSTAQRLAGLNSQLTSNVTLLATAGNTVPFVSTPSSQFAVSCSVDKFVSGAAALTSQFTQSAIVNVTKPFVSNISSNTTQTIVYTRVRIVDTVLVAFATELVAVGRIVQEFANLQSTASLAVSVTVITATNKADLVARTTLVAQVRIIRPISASLNVTSSLTALAGKRVIAAAALQVNAFELVVGNVINLEFTETWTIPAEDRNAVIVTENRLWTIPAEVRIHTVKPIELEPAVWVVPSEDRTYIIKG